METSRSINNLNPFKQASLTAVIFLAALATVALAPSVVSAQPGDVTVKDGFLSLGLNVQMFYQYLEKDMGEEVHPEYSSQFKWRRIRPTATGHLLDDDLRFYLHLNVAPGALELMDFYVDYTFFPEVRLRVGQYKVPFTRYRIQSYSNLQFVDWAIVTKYFGAERNLGISLHNGYEKPMPIEYEIGLFTGRNSRTSHGVGISQVTGEPVTNPSDLVEPAAQDEFHPAVGAHMAYNYDNIQTAYETDFEKTGFRFAAGASAVWDANPVPYRDFSLRVAPELLMKFYGISLSGNYYMGFDEPDGEMARTALSMTGFLVNASYLISKWVEVSARYAQVDTDKKFREDAMDRAQDIISAESDPETAEALADQYANVGRIKSENEITACVNIYLVGRKLKLQNDASWLGHVNHDDEEKQDFRFRTQLQLAF